MFISCPSRETHSDDSKEKYKGTVHPEVPTFQWGRDLGASREDREQLGRWNGQSRPRMSSLRVGRGEAGERELAYRSDPVSSQRSQVPWKVDPKANG